MERAEQRVRREPHLVEEHLVELAAAGHLPQRAHLDARASAMSTRKNEMPAWRGASGSVRARRIPRSATRPLEHHTFWPVTTQSSPSALGPRAQAGQVAPGAGLGEQLAPHLVGLEDPAQVGPLLLRRAEGEDRAAGEHDARPC